METKTLVAVDGNSLLHRAYHALEGSNLRAPDGTPSWAIKGLWSHTIAAVNRVGGQGLVVAFDTGKSFRHETYSEYKSGRSEKPEDLKKQLNAVVTHLRNAGVQVLTQENYEADDLLASVASQAPEQGWNTVLVTSDRDAFACINETTKVLRVVNGGHENWPLLTPTLLRTLVGVDADEYKIFAALRGDPADNLEGIKGVGPKTATKLLNVYHTDLLKVILENPDELKNTVSDTIVKKLVDENNLTNFKRNLKMMTMETGLKVGDLNDTMLPLEEKTLFIELDKWELKSVKEAAKGALIPNTYEEERYIDEPVADLEFESFTLTKEEITPEKRAGEEKMNKATDDGQFSFTW